MAGAAHADSVIRKSVAVARNAAVCSRRRLWCCPIVFGVGWLVLGGGCRAPVRTVPPVVDPDTLGETGFVHYLSVTVVVTVDEGARAVLALVGDAGVAGDFESRWAALRERGAVRDQWRVTAETVLDRGSFAYMLCGVLGVPPGLNDRWSDTLGWGGRRAATRTAVYEGLLDYGPAHEPISGGVVASSLVRAAEWMDRRNGPSGTGP